MSEVLFWRSGRNGGGILLMERINDKLINDTFKIIVKALEGAGYEYRGGGYTLAFFKNPPIKLFINDIKGVNNEASITVQRYT